MALARSRSTVRSTTTRRCGSSELADYAFTTASDCEVILPLYQRHGGEFINRLRGMFAFVLFDSANDHWLIARDPIGIIPLYYGFDQQGRLYVASEMKALMEVCVDVHEFPPGHCLAERAGPSHRPISSRPGGISRRYRKPLLIAKPCSRRWMTACART